MENSVGVTAFFEAIRVGDKDIISEFLMKNRDMLLAVDDKGHTPLHLACLQSNLKLVELLLSKNADCDLADPDVMTLSLNSTKIIIEKSSIFSYQNIYGQTPLHIILEQNRPNFINLFLRLSIPIDIVNIQDENGDTLFHIATWKENCKVLEHLVSQGINIDLPNYHGQTALHVAVQKRSPETIDKLINLGASVNLKDFKGKSPLHLSVSRGVLSIVGRLVQSGADLEMRDSYGNTPIHYAATCESLEILKYLYFSGSQICVNHNQQTLIHVALENCSNYTEECEECLDIIDWLLSMHVQLDAKDWRGETVIHYAARKGLIFVLEHLKDLEDTNWEFLLELPNVDGQTALHLAAVHDWKVFDYLLGENADPGIKDSKGVTPFELLVKQYEAYEKEKFSCADPRSMIFHYISSKSSNIIYLLLEQGSSIETKFHGNTPLIYAVDRGCEEATNLLIESGADLDAKSDNGLTALHVAVKNNKTQIAETLLFNGADVNVKTEKLGQTPLHLALLKREVSCCLLESLLKYGALIDSLDYKRKTPLDYISYENMRYPKIKFAIAQNIISLKTVNMLSIPVSFRYDEIKDFQKCCLEERELMKIERCGRNSLYDIFLQFKNPTYIHNDLLESKINSLEVDDNKTYPIYASLLKQTFKSAKERYTLLQDAQCFFKLLKSCPNNIKLPDEVERMILYCLDNNELQTLIASSHTV